MMTKALTWFGFGGDGHAEGKGHPHGTGGGHGHTHGVVDPSLVTTGRGIWALKWSFAILGITAAFQLAVVFWTGSVALLADTIHNIGDATTAIPLWVAFVLARRKPSKTFTYGLGRVEDLAGILIVLIILFSAMVAGYEAINRLINPQPVTHLVWLTAAGIIGFVGNEAVAVFRIRVGRQINSAALIADGYHARTDGLTSLAVVLGAAGVWLGFPLADPIIGLLITIAIFGIVWQSARAIFTRALDGVEPTVTAEIRHAAEDVPGIARVIDAKARWIGHRLHADIAIAVDAAIPLAAAKEIAGALKHELFGHIPALRTVNVAFESSDTGSTVSSLAATAQRNHHSPEPFRFESELAEGVLEMVDTSEGERMRLTLGRQASGLTAKVVIQRPGGNPESLRLDAVRGTNQTLQSSVAPAKPHEFTASLHLAAAERSEVVNFQMVEPAGHRH